MRGFMLLFLLVCSLVTQSIKMEVEDPEAEEPSSESHVKINFASVSAGAVVLEKSKASKGYGNLLSDDKDKYGIAPCSEKKWLIIGLSEDILVRTVVMENYEKYSSLLHEFQVLGSTSYPSSSWHDFGVYAAEARLGHQEFNLTTPAWARYLKFRFLSQHGTEFYCTLSQIKVYGSTVLETFKREVEISELEMLNMRNSIQMETDLHAPPAEASAQDASVSREEPKGGPSESLESESREVGVDGELGPAEDSGTEAVGTVEAVSPPISADAKNTTESFSEPSHSNGAADALLTSLNGAHGNESLPVSVEDIASGLPPVEVANPSEYQASNTSLEVEAGVATGGSEGEQHSSNGTVEESSEDTAPPGEGDQGSMEDSTREKSSSNSLDPSTNELINTNLTESSPGDSDTGDGNSSEASISHPSLNLELNVTVASNGAGNTSANVSISGSTSNASEETAFKRTSDLNCVDILKYSSFKARMLSKISIDVEKHAVTSQDNVFKLLMQKIKVLETNTAIMELYASQLYECYRLHALNMTISVDILNDTRKFNRTMEYKILSQVTSISFSPA